MREKSMKEEIIKKKIVGLSAALLLLFLSACSSLAVSDNGNWTLEEYCLEMGS